MSENDTTKTLAIISPEAAGSGLVEVDGKGGRFSASYTPRLLAAMADLLVIQNAAGPGGTKASDTVFAKNFLKCSHTTWSRLKNAKYPVSSVQAQWDEACDEMAVELEGCAREARMRLQQAAQLRTRKLVPLKTFESVEHAVNRALVVKGDNRLIVYPAPTGGGKTALLEYLSERVPSFTSVQAKPSWRDNYADALKDVAAPLGVTFTRNTSKGQLENAIAEKINTKGSHVLAIDEGNYFTPDTIDLLKFVLNATGSVIVLCCTETHFTRMKEHWGEWVQLRRRIAALVPYTLVQPQDVEAIGEGMRFENARAAHRAIAKSANENGAFDQVHRILDELAQVPQPIPAGEVEAAINRANRIMGIGWEPARV